MPPRTKSLQEPQPGQSSKQGYRFLKAADVRQSLRNQNEATLIEVLTALRNQLTIKSTEDHVAIDDERLLLVKSWLDTDPAADGLFELWERTKTRQIALLSLILSVLSSIIALLSTHYTYHPYAGPIIRTAISSPWLSKLNSYLSATHNELLLVTLKLYNNLSAFAGGRERRSVLEAFPWELKTLPKLLHMRQRSKGDDSVDILARPDIRTLYILFLLSFVDSTTSTAVKAAFLEQRRDGLVGVFKGLFQDAHTVVRRVLECCWTGIWCDPKVKRTAKISLFNEQTVQQVLRLYERNVPESEDQESVPADVAHHFLLAICTRPGTGICFKDRGWYPREDEDQPTAETAADSGRRQNFKIYNKILAGVLKGLKVNEDTRQQELALHILDACPELVAGYWHAAALTLEPRLSSKWIANIAFFGLTISLPVPHASFLLSGTDFYHPSPPALSTILENILPSVNIKAHLSRGLQLPSPLVQHCAALALAKCLTKFGAVARSMRTAAAALEEDGEEGQWSRRAREVEREVARRVPDFQVVVAFGQQKTAEMQAAKDQGAVAKAALLAESAQRLLWLYHEHLPALVSETRFDVGKLLQGIQESVSQDADGTTPHAGLVALRQLHVLRLLRESEDFSWSSKAGSRGNLGILLRLYIRTSQRPMKAAVANLLRQTLSTTAAFQHDPDEVDLWLRALPVTKRFPGATAPDGTPLADEGEAVVALLDDCLQRCIKTPYRYLEELQALCAPQDAMAADGARPQDPALLPSPMLVTVLEQVQAKANGNIFAPSDALAVVSFVRRLALGLASKVAELEIAEAIASRICALILEEEYYGESVCKAVARECRFVAAVRGQLASPTAYENMDNENEDVKQVLNRLQDLVSGSAEAREKAAYETLDWIRLTDPPISSQQFDALVSVVEGLHKPALVVFFDFIIPGKSLVCGSEDLVPALQLDFATLFLLTHPPALVVVAARNALVHALPTSTATDVKRAFRLIDHRLLSTEISDAGGLLRLLAESTNKVKHVAASTLSDAKQFLFKLEGVQRICRSTLSEPARSALDGLLLQTVITKDSSDQELIQEFTIYWEGVLTEELSSLSEDQVHTAIAWLHFMSAQQVLRLIDHLVVDSSRPSKRAQLVLESIMNVLSHSVESSDASGLLSRLPLLLHFQSFIPGWEKVIALALDGYLPSFYDGSSITASTSSSTVAELVFESSSWWRSRGHGKHPVDIHLFLEQQNWTELTASIVVRLTYSQALQRPAVRDWFRSGGWQTHPIAHVVPVLRALLDACLPLSPFADEDEDSLISLCKSICKEMVVQRTEETQKQCGFCIERIASTHPPVRPQVVSYLEGHMKRLADRFNPVLFSLAIKLDAKGSLGSCAVEYGLKWAVSALSADGSALSDLDEGLKALHGGLEAADVKAHYAESAVIVAIQSHLSDANVMALVQTILKHVQFKPVTVNRFLQNLIQNPKFQVLVGSTNTENTDYRNGVIGVLHTLFHTHPTNTCQSSHVEPLATVYGGTMSSADRQLLSIFRLFEVTRKTSISTLLSRWTPASDATCATVLEAVQNLDPTRVMKTCISFPQYYGGPLVESDDTTCDVRNYDPIFVMLLLSRMLTDSLPTTALGWVQLFRTNVISLLIRALSSHKEYVRALAMSQLAGLHSALQAADMQEKPHVIYILDILKNIYSDTAEDYPPRIAAYTTLHLAHALRSVFYPATFTYPLTARFLLQRQEFDTNDVPLLYSTLYSAGDQWKKERIWIVRFLADGMVGRQEWRVLKRRHTWDLLASIFQSGDHDQNLRRGVLELLANMTCNQAAATSLVLGSGLLSWIELQLQTAKSGESLAWVKILENIVTVLDLFRLGTSTAGEWRLALSRCLLRLLDGATCDKDVLVHAAGVVLRLSTTSSPPNELDALVSALVGRLEVLEKELQLEPTATPCSPQKAPHASGTLWQTVDGSVLSIWGFCIENLWRASMCTDEKTASWDALTSRLLVWRALAGETTQVGEWARGEMVRNLSL